MLHSEINYDHVYYLRNYSVHRYILTSLVKSFIEQKEKKGKKRKIELLDNENVRTFLDGWDIHVHYEAISFDRRVLTTVLLSLNHR